MSPRTAAARAALGLALGTVAVQLTYPLAGHRADGALIVAIVVLLSAAALTDTAGRLGRPAAGFLLATVGFGYSIELLGIHTGWPFGRYSYTGLLGPRLLGVPVLVPLCWTMLAWPSLALGRRIGARERGSRLATAVGGGLAMASWDLFLDPQLIAAKAWVWAPGQPGWFGVPFANAAGWAVAGTVLIAVLDRLLPDDPRPPRLALGMFAWSWAGSVVANLVFFDRPGVALEGGLVMGALLAAGSRAGRPAAAHRPVAVLHPVS